MLGGGIVHIGEKAGGLLGFRSPVKFFQEAFHAPAGVPAHDWSRDFVADRIAKDRRMASTGSHSSAHTFLDSATKFFIVEEGDMLLPRQTYHDAETLLLRSIQQPARRHTVSADSVHAVSDDLGKVSLNNVRMWVLAAVFIGAEWPISHTANIEFVEIIGNNSRSEEHTSELQSRSDLVCRLLLEKKKKQLTLSNLKNTTS